MVKLKNNNEKIKLVSEPLQNFGEAFILKNMIHRKFYFYFTSKYMNS
jgi:hypothetical protein